MTWIPDSVSLLDYLFLGRSELAEPFPDEEIDFTEDGLICYDLISKPLEGFEPPTLSSFETGLFDLYKTDALPTEL